MAAPVIKSTQYDAAKGAWIERGTFTVTPGAVGAASQVTVNPDTSSPTCAVGDQIFVNPRAVLPVGLVFIGASVSGANTVSLVFYNPTAGSLTGTSQTFDYELLHYS